MAGERFHNSANATGLAAQTVNMAGERFPNLENAQGIAAQSANMARGEIS